MFKRTKFQEVIEKVLANNGLLEDFYSDKYEELLVELSMKNFDDLTIRRKGHIVSAGHYYVVEQPVIRSREVKTIKTPDPILHFVLQEDNVWFPFKSELALATFTCACYEETAFYPLITKINHAMKKDIIDFSNIFASNIEHQGWLKAELKHVVKIDKMILTTKEQTSSCTGLKEAVKKEIIDALSKAVLPESAVCIAQLYGPFERLWIYEYKGFHFILGDSLDGFYGFEDMLDDFLRKADLTEEDLFSRFVDRHQASNY